MLCTSLVTPAVDSHNNYIAQQAAEKETRSQDTEKLADDWLTATMRLW